MLETRIYPLSGKATLSSRLSPQLSMVEIAQLQQTAQRLAAESPYGWGHTIDFGPFQIDGLLLDSFLQIAGCIDAWGWWPSDLSGMRVADVGCFTGGLSLLMAERGAQQVYAVDEIAPHLAQCAFVMEALQMKSVDCLHTSLYQLPQRLAPASLDLILLSGVLYHLSDMMVALIALQSLLKPNGVLLIESASIRCATHSYANFSRFVGGGWWHPTALCIQDMCEFTGYEQFELRFYVPDRCLVRVVKPFSPQIMFKRGMNWPFPSMLDEKPRTLDHSLMPPLPCQLE